jgi:hypothetical protein
LKGVEGRFNKGMRDRNSIIYVLKRAEKKYLLSRDKYLSLLERIKEYFEPDRYAFYTICNIYYDTDDYQLIRTSIEKPKYKEKLRIRSYGTVQDTDPVFVELKRKYKGTVFKRRGSLSLQEAIMYLDYGIKPEEDDQILREIDYFINFYKPKPKFFISYERAAYVCSENRDIRLTFDSNILSRDYDLDLRKGVYGTPLLEENMYLMELKVPYSIPFWLARTLSELEIYPTSFSKYGNVYKKYLENRRGDVMCSPAYLMQREAI